MERRGSREEQVVFEVISPEDMVMRGPRSLEPAVRPSEDMQDLEEQNFSSEGGIFGGFDTKLVLEILLYWAIMFFLHLLMAVGVLLVYMMFGGLQQIVTIVGWTMVSHHEKKMKMTSSASGRFVLASTSLVLLLYLFIFGIKLRAWLTSTNRSSTLAYSTRREKASYFILFLFHIAPALVAIVLWSLKTEGLVAGMLLQTSGTLATVLFWYLNIKDYEHLTLHETQVK
jgi:hypothetical protein